MIGGPFEQTRINLLIFVNNMNNAVIHDTVARDLQSVDAELAQVQDKRTRLICDRTFKFDYFGGLQEPEPPGHEEVKLMSRGMELGMELEEAMRLVSTMAEAQRDHFGVDA